MHHSLQPADQDGFRLISTLNPSHLPHWPNATACAPSATALSQSHHHHILILDSSHNPPTRAHAHLVSTGLRRHSHTPYTAVLLLLATRNADKGHLPASAIAHRTKLMHLLATHLAPSVPTAIATTGCALFADKANAFQAYLQDTHATTARLDWITGNDTLIRIMHPKYYPAPKSVRQVIVDEFLEPTRSRLLVAPRPNVGVPEGADEALIAELEASGFVVWLTGVDANEIDGVSSSLARDLRKRGHQGWQEWVVPEVAEYIEQSRLYEDEEDTGTV
ncbi:hypothetical protein BCR44DRAFT_1215716 [Catenaria anguillulae PL171]|uniref:Nicotinamide-nucleotide adenylyltransferase n=1 Tax=Catenaria anguillulae PL171 TaxID=765915 RepID=A0A1Y2HYW1_9FUNG|nr:hypothetical protein BCR44DRAFT_1215716 [Catenaria anguillulae PL171]